MQFIIDEIGYHNTANENAANAMERWQQREQAARNEQYSKEFLKMIGNPTKTELDSVRLLPKQKMRSGIFLISVIRIRNGRKS